MLSLEYLSALHREYHAELPATVQEFSLGGKHFAFNTAPSIMGVINLSPDSWYRESVCLSTESALRRARVLIAQGASLVDIGAESTLAQAARTDEAEQAGRMLPLIRELRSEKILCSAETYLPSVVREALEAGAVVLNLTGAGSAEIYREVAAHDAAVILCYVEGANVREVRDFDLTRDAFPAMEAYFQKQAELAIKNGVKKIIIDPGLGFYYRNLQDSATRVRHQMTVFLNTFRLRKLGFPVCHALPHAFEFFGEEVRSAEPFFAVLAALGRTDLFRTHEVARTRAVIETLKVF